MERAGEIDALLFVASDRIANERPITGNALLAEAPPDAATRARLASARLAADGALKELERLIPVRPYPGDTANQPADRAAG